MLFHFRCFDFTHRPQARPVIIQARHQNRSRRRTAGEHMKIRQPQTLLRQTVQCGGRDLPTKGTNIRISQIVRDDQQNIRPRWFC